MPWIMALSSPPSSGLESIIACRSKSRNPVLTQAEVSSLRDPVWSVNPFRNIVSRFSCSRQLTNASLSWGDARSGVSIAAMNCSAPPASAMQDSSSLEELGHQAVRFLHAGGIGHFCLGGLAPAWRSVPGPQSEARLWPWTGLRWEHWSLLVLQSAPGPRPVRRPTEPVRPLASGSRGLALEFAPGLSMP